MRSRYTAYVLGLEDYLRVTWHASTRPTALNLGTQPVAKWLGLDVKSRQAADAEDTAASVEFVARYRVGGRAVRLHEVSRFVCEAGRWYYVDGVVD